MMYETKGNNSTANKKPRDPGLVCLRVLYWLQAALLAFALLSDSMSSLIS